uniref:Helix-turn-helix XRE-family like protein n=1 Tax=Myoviridae sp. ct8iP21 TaxID=2825041 RepID=A0A8S5V3Z3_9CAUD|nr:MAG TPA: Helix-turn-helix XRE-family like protein [Myoviridae sp. ct8iP21]
MIKGMNMEILIWQVRTKRGLSCRQLAHFTGLSKSTINNLENRKTSPTLEELYTISKALHCHISDLYSE